MRIMVTGGAGYIGSHVLRALVAAGHDAVVLDDLREGHRQALICGRPVPLAVGDIADPAVLDEALGSDPVDGVIHMAASCQVGESMKEPGRYFDNNVVRTLAMLDHLMRRGVSRFVFSSTAAVYGDPHPGSIEPIREDHPTRPTNVYGETKLAVERALDWYCRCAGVRAVSLRYFNAAGADPSGTIGEDHAVETHLIPLVLKAALGRVPHLTILGRDYPTPDGTCLRDYIHVTDLAAAHVLALGAIQGEGGPDRLRISNLGAGKAASVLEVIAAAARVTGREIPAVDGPRRAGDPPVLLASSGRIRSELGWKPVSSDLDAILTTAWNWHRAHPDGYA